MHTINVNVVWGRSYESFLTKNSGCTVMMKCAVASSCKSLGNVLSQSAFLREGEVFHIKFDADREYLLLLVKQHNVICYIN